MTFNREGNMKDDLSHVVSLDELDDFKVAEGDPDVRGWEVYAADGRKIGEVDQLLVDTAARKVRYLDVDLDDDLLGGVVDDRHILIPIGYARLQEDEDRVIIDELDSTRVRTLPNYGHEPLTREYEATLVRAYDSTYSATDADLYGHRLYDENRFYGPRRT